VLTIRSLKIEDVPHFRQMIFELASYEKLAHEMTISEETLAHDGFSSAPHYRALIAEWAGEPAGYAMFFPVYNSFQGASLFLGDIYVRDRFRGRSIGKGLMAEVAPSPCAKISTSSAGKCWAGISRPSISTKVSAQC